MRLFLTSFYFFMTLVVGAFAFAATAIEFPSILNQLIETAQQLPSVLSGWGVPDKYMVWLNILLTGDKLVLLGYVLVTRIIFSLIAGVFGSGHDSGSSFDRWGR